MDSATPEQNETRPESPRKSPGFLFDTIGDFMKLKTISLILAGTLLVTTASRAQNALPDTFIAGKITVTGNKETKAWVIEREADFEPGDTVTAGGLKRITQRIEATGLFNRVETLGHFNPETGQTDIEFKLTESFYLIPYPVLYFNAGHYDQLNYGAGLVDRNFRGNGDILAVSGWLGFAPGFSLFYENPWIGGKNSRHYLSGEITQINYTNRSLFWDHFTEEYLTFQVFVKKYLNRFLYAGAGAEMNRINLATHLDVNPDGKKKFWYFVPFAEVSFDNRDFQPYPHKGIFLKYRISKYGLSNPNIDNWAFSLDNRFYLPLAERHALAFKSFHQFYSSEPEVFQKSYFGYEQRLRGYFYRIFESNNLSLNTLEYRFPITDIRYFTVQRWADMFGDMFKNLKYGLSGSVFINNGISWNNLKEVSLRKSRTGYGLGLNVIVPFVETVRIESAWDDRGNLEGILDVGISF